MLIRNVILCTGFCSLLFGCGGSTVVLDLTDAPPDLQTLEHVYISLSAVEVHVVDKSVKKDGDPTDASVDKSDNWYTITPRAGRFDLIALQNDATAAIGELDVPDGKITQIRLFVDDNGQNTAVLKDGRQCPLDLSTVDENGIKINHPFKAIDLPTGETVRVVIDFDLRESVDQQAECTFSLHPVIKLKKSEVVE